MILGEIKELLDILRQNNQLLITKSNHKRSWKYYHEQYHKAFCVLLEIAEQRGYRINCKFMPFLFLMRHSLELFLKAKISNTPILWKDYGKTHNLTKLYKIANINGENFLEIFGCLSCNSEGDCFRYLSDQAGKQYFDNGERIFAYNACIYYFLFLNSNNLLTKYDKSKLLTWELTFHTTECNTLGILGTQYDFVIYDILVAIKDKQISINDVYLPLLFLLRHCLEIKLKAAILALGDVVVKEDQDKVHSTHSVRALYEIFNKPIDVAIKTIEDSEFKQESIRLQKETEQYKNAIQLLDDNSFLFRFPKDRKGNNANFIPKLNCVSEILDLYSKADSFLCFAVDVLSEAGVLEIGGDEESKYYERLFSLRASSLKCNLPLNY